MFTYITLLSSNNYIYGVLGLWYSLIKVKSKYNLLVLVTSNVTDIELLNIYHIPYIIVEEHINKCNQLYDKTTINKLYYYSLTQYDKICFLDADIIVLKNIDNFFDYESPSIYKPGDHKIWGGCIVISPNIDIYNSILWDEISNDEEFINNNITQFSTLPDKLLQEYLFHDITKNKYWNTNNLYNFIEIKEYINKLI